MINFIQDYLRYRQAKRTLRIAAFEGRYANLDVLNAQSIIASYEVPRESLSLKLKTLVAKVIYS